MTLRKKPAFEQQFVAILADPMQQEPPSNPGAEFLGALSSILDGFELVLENRTPLEKEIGKAMGRYGKALDAMSAVLSQDYSKSNLYVFGAIVAELVGGALAVGGVGAVTTAIITSSPALAILTAALISAYPVTAVIGIGLITFAIAELGADGMSALWDLAFPYVEKGVADLGDWLENAGDRFSDAIQDALRRLIDPLVLDLDGDGVELVSRATSGVFFDMDGDGRKELTGWLGPDDGFLVIDQDNDGLVESINDLIGDLGQSGFSELATYDLNGDKVINASDTIFSRLRIWVDGDTDGVTDAGELITLGQAGIRSIDLNFTTVNFTAADNRIHEQSVFERTNGTVGTIVDAWFDVDNVVTGADTPLTGVPTIDALPDVPGSGELPSLRSAMKADGALLSLVASLVARGPAQLAGASSAVEQILFRWAGAHGVDPASRGGQFDARALVTLEKVLGTAFVAQGNVNPNAASLNNLNASWESLVDGMAARLLLAGPLGAFLPNTFYAAAIDRIVTTDDPATLFAQLRAGAPAGDALSTAHFWVAASGLVEAIAEEQAIDTGSAAYRDIHLAAMTAAGFGGIASLVPGGIMSVTSLPDDLVAHEGLFSLTSGNDVLFVGTHMAGIFGGAGDDYISTLDSIGYSHVSLYGGTGNDTLVGSNASDLLNGEQGADLMYGGWGDDRYVVDSGTDQIFEATGGGTDRVDSTVSYVLPANVERLYLLGSAALNGIGNSGNNELFGTAAANVLFGHGGDDFIDGGAGGDRMEGGLGRDIYVVDNVLDRVTEFGDDYDTVRSSITFTAPALFEQIELTGTAAINATGNSANNYLYGNAAANILNGAGGSDQMYGGAGNDTYIVDGNDWIVEQAGEGVDLVQSSVEFSLSGHVENLTLTGTANINAMGNDLANLITGNAGANRLDGAGGADRLVGGLGNDVYAVDTAGDVVVEAAGGGIDTIESLLASTTLAAEVENLRLFTQGNVWDTTVRSGTGNALANQIEGNAAVNNINGLDGDDRLFGNGGNDVLAGGLANDLLDGGDGSDRMTGGIGNDSYVVGAAADIVTELAGEGTDLVLAHVSHILGANVENLELVGSGNMDGQGNALANRLTGNQWDNGLDGGAGADVMIGGDGNDTYTVDVAGDVVTEERGGGTDRVRSSIGYVLSANLEHLTLLGALAVNGTGNGWNNELIGNSAANTLLGLAGDDFIDGGAGGDRMEGGFGRDAYVVDNALDRVIETGEDFDTVRSSVSFVAPALVEQIELTGSAAINATGNGGTNYLYGNSGANILDGGGGSDQMTGGKGNDTYIVDGNDGIGEQAGEGVDLVQSSADFSLPGHVENLTLTGSASINGMGNEHANVITGNAGANRLDGGAGADRLIGGLGNDIYVVDVAGDVVVEAAGGGVDLVESLLASITLAAEVENLRLFTQGNSWDSTVRSGTGNVLANQIEGNAAANNISGLDGDDRLFGNGGNDVLAGGLGNDLLDGGEGSDRMSGGAGNDSYVVNAAADIVVEVVGEGADLVLSQVSYILGANVENLELVGSGNMDGRGNELANRLTGNQWDNNLDGGAGADVMVGGDGNDTYTVDVAGDIVTEDRGGGIDRVRSSIGYVLSANLEHLTLLGTLAINGTGNLSNNELFGNSAANILLGLGGDDIIDGGAGADRMEGGSGRDVYVVDDALDRVIETGEDFDTVRSSVTFVAPALVEQIELIGSAAINATGNSGNNNLYGNSGANILNGGGGSDQLFGGGGNDTYIVDGNDGIGEQAGEGIDLVQSSADFWLQGHVENLTLTGSAAINGTGNELANIITGNGAANRLDGGGGADRLVGGLGDDVYVVDVAGDVVVEAAGGGIDTLESLLASVTLAAEIENLRLFTQGAVGDGSVRNGTGNALANRIDGNGAVNTISGLDGDDQLFGNGGNDVLQGGLGNDLLDGGEGSDRMNGGIGNDTYVVSAAADIVTELAGEGSDLVLAHVSHILGANVENLELVGFGNMDGRGNELANRLTGNQWDNNLDGSGGADIMMGGDGNDTYTVDVAGDVVVELPGGGIDQVRSSISYTLRVGIENLLLIGTANLAGTGNELSNAIVGNSGANVLRGGLGNDSLDGGAGNDSLSGGAGTDQLTGGAGLDSFLFDSSPSGAVDRIVDFVVADDTIQLSRAIFSAISATGVLAAAAFRAGSFAQDLDDRILYDQNTGNIFYDADGSGSISAILFAQVSSGLALTQADFVAV